jgi:hypothetical protein
VAIQIHELLLSPYLALPPFRRCAGMMMTMLTKEKEKKPHSNAYAKNIACWLNNKWNNVQCVESA